MDTYEGLRYEALEMWRSVGWLVVSAALIPAMRAAARALTRRGADRRAAWGYVLVVALLLFVLLPALARGQTPEGAATPAAAQEAPTASTETPPSPPPFVQAAQRLAELWRGSGVPSLSVAVAREGRLVFSDAVGYADLESLSAADTTTVYDVGSISKVMTAVAVMQLVERGAVDLDDPIQKFVPSFPDHSAIGEGSTDGGRPITIWNLMTHTSGIRHYAPDDFPGGPWADNVRNYESIEDAIGIFKDDPLLFEPGAYFRYSSYAVNLLQGVIETASGLGFEDYMRRHVWAPAGMLSTAFDVPQRIVPRRARPYRFVDGQIVNYVPNENLTYKFASGGMMSTAEDLVRFGVAVDTSSLLSPEATEVMLSPQLDGIQEFNGTDPPSDLRWEQAMMWRIRRDELDRPDANHCGTVTGFNACLIIYRDEHLVVGIIDNGSGAAADLGGARSFAEVFRTDHRAKSSD